MEDETLLNTLDIFSSLGLNEHEDEPIDEDTKDDINLEVEEPHLVFYKSDLIKALSLGIGLVQPKSDVGILKSITLIPSIQNKRLYFHTTNDMSYFRYNVELLGDTNLINTPISIPLNIIQKLISLMGVHVLIYQKENLYYIRLLGGDLILDTAKIEPKYLTLPGRIGDKLAELPINSIGKICKITYPLIQNDIRGENRKLQLTSNEAIYISNMYYIKAQLNAPELILRLKDIDYINRLYKNYRNEILQIFKVEDSSLPRYVFITNNTEYQTIISKPQISDLVKDQMNKLISDFDVEIDFRYLTKIIALANNLPSSTGKIGFKRTTSGLSACIVSKSGESCFDIPINTKYTNHVDKAFKYVNAEPLKRLVNALELVSDVKIAINDKAIILAYNNIVAVFMHTN